MACRARSECVLFVLFDPITWCCAGAQHDVEMAQAADCSSTAPTHRPQRSPHVAAGEPPSAKRTAREPPLPPSEADQPMVPPSDAEGPRCRTSRRSVDHFRADGGWTAYERDGRADERHARVSAPGDSWRELRTERDELRLKLESPPQCGCSWFRRSARCGCIRRGRNATERAATVMHDVLIELLATGSSLESDAPAPAAYEVVLGGSNGAPVMLSITPSQLVFHSMQCDANWW